MLTFLIILFVLVSLLLIFMVVITPAQGEGLASAFGGGGGESFFGTKAGAHVNRFTIFLATAFIVLSVAIGRVQAANKGAEKRSMLNKPPAESPAASPAPTTPPAPGK